MKSMKRYNLSLITALFLALIPSVQAIEYEEVYEMMWVVKTKNFDGVDYVPFYILSKKAVNFEDANFRLSSKEGKILKLNYTILKNIPVKELNHEDIESMTEGYSIKLWVPKDLNKYKGWTMQHDLEEGSLVLSISKVFTNKTIEEKREKLKK
jgi:hypothetical protein